VSFTEIAIQFDKKSDLWQIRKKNG
jgi:hypothetical protein